MKRPGNTSIDRALNCTKDIAIRHLGELADELIESELFTKAEQVEPGVWTGNIDTSKIFNHDETPQFVESPTMESMEPKVDLFTVAKARSVNN